jgi:hypothetical protein
MIFYVKECTNRNRFIISINFKKKKFILCCQKEIVGMYFLLLCNTLSFSFFYP